jgi:hypothetical protein
MVASEASAHNFFRRLIRPKTTVVRTYFYPITGTATSSPPCSTSSPWRGWPVSTRGRGPPEALTRASARKGIKAKRRRSHHIAVIGLRARIRQPATGNHGCRHLSLAPQAPDGVCGTHSESMSLRRHLGRGDKRTVPYLLTSRPQASPVVPERPCSLRQSRRSRVKPAAGLGQEPGLKTLGRIFPKPARFRTGSRAMAWVISSWVRRREVFRRRREVSVRIRHRFRGVLWLCLGHAKGL